MISLGVLVIGVTDLDRATSFWAEALGYQRSSESLGGWPMVLSPTDSPPASDSEQASDHVPAPDRPAAPSGGRALAFQLSETPPEPHPRIHLDLHVIGVDEQRAEIDRLLALGATRVDWDSYPEDPDFVVLADPDGNRFCIVDLGHEPR